jgi:hypothetical protein
MAVSWGNAECFDERPGKRLATATAPGAAPETARGGHSPGTMRAGRAAERAGREHMTRLPDHADVLRMAAFLEDHPGWSAFWDKRDGVWRAAEDDPSSELHVEDADASRVIDYMATHTRRDVRHDHGV